MKAANDRNAICRAFSFVLLASNSPINAPAKGANSTPHIPRNNPTNIPMVAPRTPYFEPPFFFVSHAGAIKSNIVIMAAAMPVAIIVVADISLSLHGNSNSSPAKESGGPGSAGSTEPISPIIVHKKARITQKYSMLFS